MALEGRITVERAELYFREVGTGRPIIVLHGGPDFDQRYLLPDLDRLADGFRLVYYDQRGRGRSGDRVRPEDVTVDGEIRDLDHVRQHFGFDEVALLGHSWGTTLALEYALRHPGRVSRLILMNPAPASREDYLLLKQGRDESDVAQLKALSATAGYRDGDPDAVAAYYRVHFRRALARVENLDRVIASLRASFSRRAILKARAIEDRLMAETWLAQRYDLLPQLAGLSIATLVIWGDRDFVPLACAQHIAQALPEARLVILGSCGHFSYLECPDEVRRAIGDFLP